MNPPVSGIIICLTDEDWELSLINLHKVPRPLRDGARFENSFLTSQLRYLVSSLVTLEMEELTLQGFGSGYVSVSSLCQCSIIFK